MQPKTEPLYITTNAAGGGTVQFTARKSGIITNIIKTTLEMTPTSSGMATVYKNGGEFLTSLPIAPQMEARGSVGLYSSEYITFTVVGGPVNSTIKVNVFYEELPESDYSPSTVLAFEQQTGPAGPVDNPVLLASETALAVPTGGVAYNTSILDMRAYNSYAIQLKAEDGSYLVTDLIEMQFRFYADPAGAVETFTDQYRIYKTNILGSSTFELTDPVHGAYMKMILFDPNATARGYNLTYSLYGSFRSVPSTWLRTCPNGVITERRAALLGAGLSDVQAARLGYGRAKASLLSGVGGGATLTIAYGGSTMADVLTVAGANTRITQEIVMPRYQPRVTITNNGAGASTIDAHIIQQGYPQ